MVIQAIQNYCLTMEKMELPPPTPRHFYVKRKQLREDEGQNSSSIFSAPPHPASFTLLHDVKKFQTLTTAVDNTLTLSNSQDPMDDHSPTLDRSQLLPKLQSRLPESPEDSKCRAMKVKAESCHLSDPHYLRLERQLAKRVNNRLKQYQKGWGEMWERRKEKSMIERSHQHAAQSIDHTNLDAQKRKNTSDLAQLLRNNIAEKTFIFPGRVRRDLEGLKGKGGKVIPLFSEVFLIEEVYKHSKGRI